MHNVIFLDRDGVITQEPPYYAHKINELRLIKGSTKAIRKLNTLGFKVIVITNQSGIAKGYFKLKQMQDFNKEMLKRLKKKHAFIDDIFYCPHHTEGIIKKYIKNCHCRKPKIGLFKKAQKKHYINYNNSYFIGDKASDIQAGINAGCKTLLVLTGQGKKEIKKNIKYDFIASNLLEAVNIIEKNNENI